MFMPPPRLACAGPAIQPDSARRAASRPPHDRPSRSARSVTRPLVSAHCASERRSKPTPASEISGFPDQRGECWWRLPCIHEIALLGVSGRDDGVGGLWDAPPLVANPRCAHYRDGRPASVPARYSCRPHSHSADGASRMPRSRKPRCIRVRLQGPHLRARARRVRRGARCLQAPGRAASQERVVFAHKQRGAQVLSAPARVEIRRAWPVDFAGMGPSLRGAGNGRGCPHEQLLRSHAGRVVRR